MDIITHATSETSETFVKNRTLRRFCTTIYGKDGEVPTPPEWEKIKQKISYFAYAHEICPETKRPHLQCFGVCKTPMKLPGIVKILSRPENSYNHVEEMRGALDQNENYCSKEGKLIEMGTRPAQGARTDLIAVKRLLDEGKKPMEIADEHEEHFGAVMKYSRSMNEYSDYKRRRLLQNDRTIPQVYIRWGAPGSGKTRWLDDNYGTNWCRAPDNAGHWFDNCDSDVVLFDDVKINEIPPIGKILQLTDRYPIQVAKKGGFLTWKPRVIVFTSNHPPDQWWNLSVNDSNYKAFLRRVTKIEEVIYKTPDLHGSQTSSHCSQEENFPWQEEEDDLQDPDGSSQESGPASYCSEHRDEV